MNQRSSGTKEKTRPWRAAGGIRIRPIAGKRGNSEKTIYSYRVEVPASITGKRKLRIFKTSEEAEAYASVMHIQRQNQGLAAFSITDAERADAAAALSILKPFPRVTLTIAAEFYRKHFMPEGGDLQVKELVERYLAHKRSEKLRPRSIEDLKSRLTRFSAAFGDRLVKEVGHDELRAWIFDDATLQAQTKRNFRTVIHGLLRYAKDRKFVAENVAEGLPRVKVRRGEPGILSIPQARALLHAALENPDLGFGPYVTLGLFCGVRSSELRQLTWRDVRVSEKFVNIPNSVAKRRIRNIPLEANAIAWLSAFGIQNSGPICPSGAVKKFNRLIEKANELSAREEGSSQAPQKFAPILEWPDNALRHSAASYFYAWTGNAQETCARLGQKNDDVLFNHYRALIRRDDGAAFYALMPPSSDFEPLILTAEANAA